MDIDLDLYRREVRVSNDPLVRISAIDVSPDRPRRTFIFVHGFGGQAEQWHYQLQDFLIENRVIALDLRGHGLSDKPLLGYDMPQILSDLETAIEVLKVTGKFVLIGHSFGGAIATEFATAHPDRVEFLILIATAGEFKLQPFYRFGLNLPNWLLGFAGLLTRKSLSAPPHVLKPFYKQNLSQWAGWNKFSNLTLPTLVIRGVRDQVFESTFFENVARKIPNVQEINILASGHMVMLERREAVKRAIERFLSDDSQRSWRDPSAVTRRKLTNREALRKERPWLIQYEPGVPYTIGIPNIPLHHLLRSSVRRFPNHAAIFFEGSTISYRYLNHQANRFANALQMLGVVKGSRIILLLPNTPQIVIGFYGTLKAGAVAVFIPPMIEPEEIIRQVKEVNGAVVVTLSIWAGLAMQIQQGSGVPHIVLTDGAEYLSIPRYLVSRWRNRPFHIPNAIRWNTLLSGQSIRSPVVDVQPEDLAVVQYTGGTTGQAKGVMLTHRNLVANALQTRHWIPEAREGKERFLSVVPIFHSYGLTTALNVPVALGATMILKAQFQTLNVLETIKKYKPTIFAGVPSMYVALNNFRDVRKYDIRSIRACISGSAPLPVEVQEAFKKLTKGRLVEGYGLTETSPVTHANPLGSEGKIGTIGVPIPSTEAKLFDLIKGENEVRPGHIGELAIRGPQVMMGYWKNPTATKAVLKSGGWLLTGDVAQEDEEGFFRIIARKADMWYPTRPGKPAFPRDVEEVIYEIPQVKEVSVVAIGRHPIAFVIAGGTRPSAEAVIAYCKRRLPPHLVPRFVIFMEDFPRTFIGKVLRKELSNRYEQHSK